MEKMWLGGICEMGKIELLERSVLITKGKKMDHGLLSQNM